MCTEDSPSGLWRTLGKRVGCKPSGVRIPHPPPPDPGTASGSGVFFVFARDFCCFARKSAPRWGGALLQRITRFPLSYETLGENRGTKYEISTTVCGVVPALGSAGVPGAVGPGRPRDRHTRACGSEVSISKPARALRTLRRPPHSGAWSLMCGSARRLEARPGPAAAHRHRGQAMQPSPPSLGVLWWPAIGRSRAAEPRPRSP